MTFLISYCTLWFLVAFLAVLAVGLLRQITVLKSSFTSAGLTRDDALVIGSREPHFSTVELRSGSTIGSGVLRGRASLLLFLSPHCSLCRQLLDKTRSLSKNSSLSVLAICNGDKKECMTFVDSAGKDVPLLLDEQKHIGELYGISSYPVAVAVDSQSRVRAYGYPGTSAELEDFARRVGRELNSDSLQLTATPRSSEQEALD